VADDSTLLARILFHLKNNPGVVTILLLSSLAVGIASFTEAIERIMAFVKRTVPSTVTPVRLNASSPAILWSCRAENSAGNLYIIDQLNPKSGRSDIAVYEKRGTPAGEGAYIGTADLSISLSKSSKSITGYGRIGSRNIRMQALGRTSAFLVEDDYAIPVTSTGRCWLFTEMAGAEMRENVRNCLEVARRKFGGVSEVDRYGCQSEPAKHLQILEEAYKALEDRS
jgi:hypothetical protein